MHIFTSYAKERNSFLSSRKEDRGIVKLSHCCLHFFAATLTSTKLQEVCGKEHNIKELEWKRAGIDNKVSIKKLVPVLLQMIVSHAII